MRIKWIAYLGIDLLLIAAATVAALILRDNLELSEERGYSLLPYLGITLLVSAVVLWWSGTHRAIWRASAMHDYLRLLLVSPLIVALAVATGFAVNRLEGVARAIPILQTLLMLALLLGARLAAQVRHKLRNQPRQFRPVLPTADQQIVLLVGLSRLTEAYLSSVAEFAADRVHVAGLLGRYDRQVGRVLGSVPILGEPEQLEAALLELETHGLPVDKIIVSVPEDRLSQEARAQLARLSGHSRIQVKYLAEMLGLSTRAPVEPAPASRELSFTFAQEHLDTWARRPYWRLKRAFDVAVAATLLVITAPVFIVCALLVAVDLGIPVIFWQRRPGLGGRPFHLCKLRTMQTPSQLGMGGNYVDEARISRVGAFLRRSRLDEIPQLFNIIVGDMSFVGPRPLLPVDQAPQHRARLLVRPGLTGWAQITGGRTISQDDKTALDIWYVQNASMWLDLKILAQTVPIVLFGERIARSAIQQAWQDLNRSGVCRIATDGGEDPIRARI